MFPSARHQQTNTKAALRFFNGRGKDLVVTGLFICLLLGRTATAYDPEQEGWWPGDTTPPFYTEVPMVAEPGIKLGTWVCSGTPLQEGPTIIMRTPYNIGKDEYFNLGMVFMVKFPGSYIILQDTRGSFRSNGTDILFGTDYRDGYDTYRWICMGLAYPTQGNGAAWWFDGDASTTGHIGTWGLSADAINSYAWATHKQGTPHLRAQYCCGATPEQYDAFFEGGRFRYNMIRQWTENQQDVPQNKWIEDHSDVPIPDGFLPDAHWEYACNTIAEHWVKGGWWADRCVSIGNRYQYVSAAAIHQSGWYDMFAEGTIKAFCGYNQYGINGAKDHQILIMGPGTHGGVCGDLPFPLMTLPEEVPTEEWLFNMELYEAAGPRGSATYEAEWAKMKRVWYYLMSDRQYGDDWRACSWQKADSWPVPHTLEKWYLHQGANQWAGALQKTAPTTTGDAVHYTYDPRTPLITNGGKNLIANNINNPDQKIGFGCTDQRGGWNELEPVVGVNRDDVITFESDELTKAYEITGSVKARLFVQSTAPDTDFVCKLIDVSPSRSGFPSQAEWLVSESILRACLRNGLDKTPVPMASWDVCQIDMDLGQTAWRFLPGHKIKIAIASASFPRHQPNPNRGTQSISPTGTAHSDMTVAVNTVRVCSSFPSYVELPLSQHTPDTPPVANDMVVACASGGSVEFKVDAEDEHMVTSHLKCDPETQPAHGLVDHAYPKKYPEEKSCWMVYASDKGFVGLDSFTYRVQDRQLIGNAGTVTFNVLPAIDSHDKEGWIRTFGWWNVFGGYNGKRRVALKGKGRTAGTWKFTALEPGRYEVFATWQGSALHATDTPFEIVDGGTVIESFRVDQSEESRSDFVDPGVQSYSLQGLNFQLLGTWRINSGTLAVKINNNANGRVEADCIVIRRIAD